MNDHNITHLAITMDGNRRWAKKRFLTRKLGHLAGAKNLKKIIKASTELGIKYLTLYAFSTENWNRSEDEIAELMILLENFLDDYSKDLNENNIKINILGDVSKFSRKLQDKIAKTTKYSKNNHFVVNVALNYGSREEIIAAIKKIPKEEINNLTENNFNNYLYSKNIPDPDLLIRTGGEQRLSNFLLWQIAYSELYFSKKNWPDFKKTDLIKAINNYQARIRNFGK